MQPNPDMLRLARQRRGLQQTEAAKRLGVEQPVLSRMENGLSEIREDFLVQAQKVYELPRAFFYSTDPVYGAPVSVHPMWRKKSDVSARDLDAVVAELNFRIMHIRRLLEGVDIRNTGNLPRLDVEDYGTPEKVAGVLRAHWQVPRGPLKDLTTLVEKAGVLVVHSNMGGASISGVTFSVPGMPPMIVLNGDQPADRMRFTLAHELGHLVMHRFPSPTMENEADRFASALLIPASDLKPYIAGRRVDLALLASLKPEWRVSMQSLLMAITTVAPLSQNQAQYLWKQLSARGYRLREPPELDFARERPTVVDTILEVHKSGLGYELSDIAKLVNLYEGELMELYPSIHVEAPARNKITIVK